MAKSRSRKDVYHEKNQRCYYLHHPLRRNQSSCDLHQIWRCERWSGCRGWMDQPQPPGRGWRKREYHRYSWDGRGAHPYRKTPWTFLGGRRCQHLVWGKGCRSDWLGICRRYWLVISKKRAGWLASSLCLKHKKMFAKILTMK